MIEKKFHQLHRFLQNMCHHCIQWYNKCQQGNMNQWSVPCEHQALHQLQQVCVELQRILGMPWVEEEEEWGISEPGELQQLKQRRPVQSSSSRKLIVSFLLICLQKLDC